MPDLSSLKSIGLRGWRLMQRVGVGERVLWTAATGLPAVGINASRAHVRLAAVNVRKPWEGDPCIGRITARNAVVAKYGLLIGHTSEVSAAVVEGVLVSDAGQDPAQEPGNLTRAVPNTRVSPASLVTVMSISTSPASSSMSVTTPLMWQGWSTKSGARNTVSS